MRGVARGDGLCFTARGGGRLLGRTGPGEYGSDGVAEKGLGLLTGEIHPVTKDPAIEYVVAAHHLDPTVLRQHHPAVLRDDAGVAEEVHRVGRGGRLVVEHRLNIAVEDLNGDAITFVDAGRTADGIAANPIQFVGSDVELAGGGEGRENEGEKHGHLGLLGGK